MDNKTGENSSAISLPKGGGAIKSIGETFQPNLFTGTGNFSVPIFTSPGRNDFGPKLTLQYSTGNGNGPFGMGWQLSIPRITRKTEKGLPTYSDEDVFVMSGAEDLVPVLDNNGQPEVVPDQGVYSLTRYRPRTEGLFARIEKWVNKNDLTDVFWRVITKDNITSIYGRTPSTKISDRENQNHVFEWLLEETFDAKGNHILYEYAQEDQQPDSLSAIFEKNRKYNQTYIRRILYGNTPDNLDAARRVGPSKTSTDHQDITSRKNRHYVFEVLFDYKDLPDIITPGFDFTNHINNNPPSLWPLRKDPFSSFRAGFEMRTLRGCIRRVLMLHHFKEGEVDGAPLVKSTDFAYHTNPDTQLSFMESVTVTGYKKDPQDSTRYLSRDMPPVTFKYSEFEPQKQKYQSVSAEGSDFPPAALSTRDFGMIDLFGDGLPDIINTTETGYYFWQNQGNGQLNRRHPQHGDMPAGVTLAKPNVAIGDMGGDGLPDLIVDAPPMTGFYEATPDGKWKNFHKIDNMPSFNLSDPNTRLVDLTGDGLSDVLVTRDNFFLWYQCKGEEGYEKPFAIPRQHNLDLFPDVYFSDPSGRVRLADMTGDGLNDIVLVHDGRIDYWPNLGYGNFGRRITMATTPRIGYQYDPRRLFLADLDGTGCADMVYVDNVKVHFWFNQSGNGWGDEGVIHGTPYVTDSTAIQFSDFYGTGTSCLLWSYDHGEQPGSNYKILDFCGTKKPHLLVEMSNNMGATTRARYASSTKFYLKDKKKGEPWVTNLPFPVQVLEKTEIIDHISKTKLVTTYKYHHGYYDGKEREFRGFGRVEQYDTEEFEAFTGSSLHGNAVPFENNNKAFHVPPVLTKTWFHTGAWLERFRIEKYFKENEYYKGDADAVFLDDTILPGDLSVDEEREASRALKGQMLRQEVYALDKTPKAVLPYTVTEQSFTIKCLQRRGGNHHAVFFTHPREAINYHYERNPADPRMSHTITLEVDDYGNVRKSVAIGYGRRPGMSPLEGEDKKKQEQKLLTYTETDVTNAIDLPVDDRDYDPDNYRTPLPCEVRTYEVTGLDPDNNSSRFTFDELEENNFEKLITLTPEPYETPTDYTVKQKRLIECVRTVYRSNDLSKLLELGTIESRALPGETYTKAYTPELATHIYVDSGKVFQADLNTILENEGRYVHSEGDSNWWIPSGRQTFDAAQFYMPVEFIDPFGNKTTIKYDDYKLLLKETTDPVGNIVSSVNDYRVLQPKQVTDPNDNVSEAAFDALGLVAGTALWGGGDDLTGFDTDLSGPVIDAFYDADDPHVPAGNHLKSATTRIIYDVDRFYETCKNNPEEPDKWEPAFAATLAREKHVNDSSTEDIQISFSYSDGFGREIQKKIQAEDGPLVDGGPIESVRWVGSGWTIFNNKGKPVRKYEPFFSRLSEKRHRFEFGMKAGVSPVLFYDPVERVIATIHPNNTYEKVAFDPWRQVTYDVNDTASPKNTETGDPRTDPHIGGFVTEYFKTQPAGWKTWYQQRINGAKGAEEKDAAEKTEKHASTPAEAYLDSLGRAFLTVADNGTFGNFKTRVELDIEGNQRAVLDERRKPDNSLEQRIVMRYDYHMAGPGEDEQKKNLNLIHQASMEAGERWMLNNVAGNPIRRWDSRKNTIRTVYDPLHRPTHLYVKHDQDDEILAERTIYGESINNPESLNMKGQALQIYDGAGVATNMEFDFKGNLKAGSRRLAKTYTGILDWKDLEQVLQPLLDGTRDLADLYTAADPWMDGEPYVSSTVYDALNRPMEITSPHDSTMAPSKVVLGYNDANLLEKVSVSVRNGSFTEYVKNIDYNAKGQRELIEYGNGVRTKYKYDPFTFRLSHLTTVRGTGTACEDELTDAERTQRNCPKPGPVCRDLQNLWYTYDPAGNITLIRDDAQQTVFFDNQCVEPSSDYEYDPIYRLIIATGREHIGQNANNRNWHRPEMKPHYDFNGSTRSGLPHPNDGHAMRNYTEQYEYDEVGNIMKMVHLANGGGWTRSYSYDEDSLLEAGKKSNRLSSTSLPGDPDGGPYTGVYGYDVHGNMTKMPHLNLMGWDFKDRLQATSRQVARDDCSGEKTYYVYDAGGQRVRKVTVCQKGAGMKRRKERIYLGGFEIYREYKANGVARELERETLHIMDDKQRIALVETKTIDNGTAAANPNPLTRYQLNNHLGSASLELDDDATVISYEEYHPYGSTSYQAMNAAINAAAKRYRYTGKERDEETGLYYYGARYYAPWIGRWTAADPAGLVDGANIYLYVNCNPVKLIDLTGNAGITPQQLRDMQARTEKRAEVLKKKLAQNYFSSREEAKHVAQQAKYELMALEEVGFFESLDPFVCIPNLIRETSAKTKLAQARHDLVPVDQRMGDLSYAPVVSAIGEQVAMSAVGGLMTGSPAGRNIARSVEKEVAKTVKRKVTKRSSQHIASTTAKRETIDASEVLVGTSRAQFAEDAAKLIKDTPNHPLKFLLRDSGDKLKSTYRKKHHEMIENPDWLEMGHVVSAKSGEAEKIVLQSGWINQFDRLTVEGIKGAGAYVENVAVNIGGIGVELRTAIDWVKKELIKKEVLDMAPQIIF